jgi:hypothetical protein
MSRNSGALRVRSTLVALAALALPLRALAVEASPDPHALFRDATTRIESSRGFSVHIEKRFDVVAVDGAKVQYSGALDVVARPDGGLHIDYGDDLSSKEAWYDGANLTLVDHLHNAYVTVPVTGSNREALAHVQQRYRVEMPLAPLLQRGLAAKLEIETVRARYLGIHDAEGLPCHHLLFRGEENDLQVWIDTEDAPLLRKLVVTFRSIEGAPQQELVFSEWNLDAEIAPESFRAEVPAGAIRTEFAPKAGE